MGRRKISTNKRSLSQTAKLNLRTHPKLRPRLILQREKHFHYLKRGLRQLTDAYECLDASRPWLCYWILHSLELLDEPIPQMVATDVCHFLELCQSPEGGFGGGPGQYPHLAPTYAAVNALCIIGTEEAYDIINREKLLQYLYSLKQPDGSFLMHVGGEVDVRSAYCAASVASLTNIITPDLFEGTAEWIARCQNWEGGIGGVPGMEAHGGYTFCGHSVFPSFFHQTPSLPSKTVLSSLTQSINTTNSFTLISDSGFIHILPMPGSEIKSIAGPAGCC
uniref:Farnesyltransferase, CAAX box, beta n=1 Tax=Rousettus aegyptiacus TaxID=9407 RepID=A0A7J8IIV5_ROUAE|nr:farnesyltransferase, CAAX box, beta [Rousettus aegyptiacus]